MNRNLLIYMKKWVLSHDRKPMVLRGARQVGKTWLVRHLAQVVGRRLVEFNFEKRPEIKDLFNSNDPERILLQIEAATNQVVNPDECILFLDEIQVVPELLAKLRWFAEDMPQLPVIAAGSLLEFVLAEHSFSMPVGRINYFHLEPLSFEEFLVARKQIQLHAWLQTYQWDNEVPRLIHQQLLEFVHEYAIIGGLPAAVASWVKDMSLVGVEQVQQDLLATYRDDFAKYSGKLSTAYLNDVLAGVPAMLTEKFIYSRVNRGASSASIKQALDLLIKARLCHRVRYSAANGVPLGAEVKDKFFKVTLLDTGLVSATLGLQLNQLSNTDDLQFINNGKLAEQWVGQVLRTMSPAYVEPSLYYWQREEKNASAEIDYLIQHKTEVLPIEVKAGSSGSLKSLHEFMRLKKLNRALRINADFPTRIPVSVKTHLGEVVRYELLSLPFYLLEQTFRLLNER